MSVATPSTPTKVLFICLGNSCRSPIAEAVFRSVAPADKWFADSAALQDWNVGLPPNPRSLEVLARHGLSSNHVARELVESDFYTFDYIFGMDEYNVFELESRKPDGSTAKLLLLGDFATNGPSSIRDPYFDVGPEGFHKCYQQCLNSCLGFLAQFENNPQLQEN